MTAAFLIFKIVVFVFLLYILFYFFVYNIIKKLARRRKIRTHGQKAAASVVDYRIVKDTDGVRSYYPMLSFQTADGQTINVESKKALSRKYNDNKVITVYYMKEDPTKFYISGMVPFIKIAGVILGAGGVIMLVYEIIKTIKHF